MSSALASIILSAKDQASEIIRGAGRELQNFGDHADELGKKLESSGLRIAAVGLAAEKGLSVLGLTLSNVTGQAIATEQSLYGIANTAQIYGAAADVIVGKWSIALNTIAKSTNQTKSEIITAFQDLVAQGIDDKDAIKMLEPIGRAATATGASILDMAVAGSAGFSKMQIPLDRLDKTLGILAMAGDLGKFELKNMAGYFDMLTAKSAGLGAVGEKAMGQLAAAAQIARRGTGDAASAATNLANFLDKLNATTTAKQFEKIGVDLEKVKKEARESGDFIGTMVTKIKELTGGDTAKISALFPDIQAGSFARQAVAELELYKEIAEKANSMTGNIGKKFDTQTRSFAEKQKGISIALQSAIETSDVIKGILERLNSLADWAIANPETAAFIGIGAATVAAVGLVGGAIVAGIGATITGITGLVGAMSTLGAVLLANPIMLTILGVGLVGAAVYNTDWGAVFDSVSEFWGKVKTLFAESDAWLKATFLGMNPLPIIEKSFNAVSVYFSGIVQSWKDAGANLIGALREGITSGLQGALGIGEKLSQAFAYLKGQVKDWAAIGSAIMQGIIDGLLSKYTEVVNQVKSLGTDMLKTVKSVLGIHSPSREFFAIGQMAGAGLTLGLLDKEDEVSSAAARLGELSIDAATYDISKLFSTENVDEYDKVLGSVTKSLDAYGDSFKEVSTTIVSGADKAKVAIKGLRDNLGRFLPTEEIERTQAILQRTADDINKSLTDALLRGFESGKGFAQNFRDSVKNLFNTLILRPTIQPIAQGGANFIMGLLGMGGSGSALAGTGGGVGGGGGDALSMLSSLRTAWTTVTEGLSSLGSGISAAAEDAAMFGGNVASSGTSVAGTTTSTTALGSAATYLGAAAAGFVIGKMISGGYSAFGGKSGNAAVIAGTAIGAIFGPIGMVLGGAVGGLVNRLFGRKLTETGIQGTFSGAGFSGQNYTHEKGGIFRSDRTSTSPLDAAMDESLDKSYTQLRSSALLLGNVFKDTSHSLDDFSYSLKLNFLGLSADQSKALVTGELTKMGDAMASQVLSDIARAEMATAGITDSLATQVETYWKEFERGGESATDTLTRLSGSLAGVNSWLEKLGMNMFATTLSAGNMASQLVDLFGSMDKFTGAMQKYVSIYFTATEKLGMGIKDMGESFGNLGQKMPGTLEEMRALIQAQDLTTESGRAAYAGLINLSEGFAALYQSSGQAALGGRSLMVAWQDQSAQLKTLINSFDNTTVAEAALGVAARTRYQIELALIKQINDALQSTHAMFTTTIEEMKFSTLDTAGKYKFLQDKTTELEGMLGSTIDPAEIARISADLNKATRDAWMLLSEDERKIKLAAYEKYLTDLDAMTKARLELSKSEITKEGGGQQTANEAIADAIAAGIESALARSAEKFDKAASDMQAAANTPVKVDVTAHVDVNVDVPANVEVGII